MGAGAEQPPRSCLKDAPQHPQRSHGGQASDPGHFGIDFPNDAKAGPRAETSRVAATSTLPPRAARLKELTARKDGVAKKLFAAGTPADQKPALEAQWSALLDEISPLEDTFVFYQEREIDVELVNYLSGTIPTSTEDLDGDEKLYRDGDGRYFLYRQLTHHEREHLHRVSVKGAILWALTRLNSNTLDLRADAARLLDGKEVAA